MPRDDIKPIPELTLSCWLKVGGQIRGSVSTDARDYPEASIEELYQRHLDNLREGLERLAKEELEHPNRKPC